MLKQSHLSEMFSQQEAFEKEYTALTQALSNRIEFERQERDNTEALSIAGEEIAELREMIHQLKHSVQEQQQENARLRRASLEIKQYNRVEAVKVGNSRGMTYKQIDRTRSTTPPLNTETRLTATNPTSPPSPLQDGDEEVKF